MNLLNAIRNLFFPLRANCMGCGAATGCREDWICPACREALTQGWVGASPPPEGLDAAAFAYVYRGAAVGIVTQLKYRGVTRLAGFMGGDMARAYRFIEPTGADCVTCVPMHPKRRVRRGYNHAELLARELSGRIGIPFVELLERVRDTPQQAKLEDDARRANVSGAFRALNAARGRRVLLVDDVCTTGSTATACARALRAAGAEAVYLVCYARARG
ncbi:MAG: ComF family protein [Clostridia bacterium]|nr:ComF family protein [Clostridia bacterium]